MKAIVKLVRLILAASLLLTVAAPAIPQSENAGLSPALLEISFTWCQTYCQTFTTHVYADGRYVQEGVTLERSKSGQRRKVSSREEKQLESEEVAELVSWAEQPDFLNAQPKYVVATVQDDPDWYVITYRNKDSSKSVKVVNFSSGNEAQRSKVPAPVLRLLKWANPYDFK
jgi:hypothetical protein